MSKPELFPEPTTAGIVVDPRTLERVIPESRRPDGSVRKQIKIRPGFTPQEDIRRFRGTKQAEMDARELPKGHIIGWAPPPAATKPAPAATSASGAPLSKSAKKNAKRQEKRKEKREAEKVKDSWEDEDEEEGKQEKAAGANRGDKPMHTVPDVKENARPSSTDAKETDALAEKLEKSLEIQ